MQLSYEKGAKVHMKEKKIYLTNTETPKHKDVEIYETFFTYLVMIRKYRGEKDNRKVLQRKESPLTLFIVSKNVI